MWEFHQVKALPIRVQEANLTWVSDVQLLMLKTDSVLSNHRVRPMTLSVPLNFNGPQFRFSYSCSPGRVRVGPGGSCSLWCHVLKIIREQYT
nr:hypothetical protein [Tanacetum cinerariifolium]